MSHSLNAVDAIVFHGPDDIRVASFKLGPVADDDIVVRTLYTMVSSGTELRTLAGYYKETNPFPVIPGYSAVGEVIAAGQKVKGFRVGDLVSYRNPKPVPGVNACWGVQAGGHVLSTLGSCRPVLLPPGADPFDYVIAEIAAISFRGVESAAPCEGEAAVVIGQGPIGAFSAAWLKTRGCRVLVTDLEQARLDRALARGMSAAVNGRDADAEERIHAWTGGGADLVVESSGASGGALLAYRLLRKKPQSHGDSIAHFGGNWPRLVMQATYEKKIEVNPFDFIPGEGVTILAPKDRGVEDRQKTVEAIRSGKLRVGEFVDRPVDYREAASAYRALRDSKSAQFSLVFKWT